MSLLDTELRLLLSVHKLNEADTRQTGIDELESFIGTLHGSALTILFKCLYGV